ncbi:MAG: hypothetical protein JNM38_09950 [Acidobacteria bacterium]|jgi:hypothetical protein|nr:hypothetical protein [Acidobacteriota bacterium]
MVTPALQSVSSESGRTDSSSRATRADLAVAAASKVMKQRRQEGADLVRLVEQSGAADGKGRNVSYYG